MLMRLLFVGVCLVGLPMQAQDAPKNLLFILVDDWGYSDAGVLGSDFYETPAIDRFAAQSLRFTQAYAASPVCSPTRAAILTGKSPARLQMTIWHEGAVEGGPKDRKLFDAPAQPNLPRDEFTLAELFKDHGYFTAHVGKWHLGKAANYPETQGYDLNVGGTHWGAPASFFFPYRGTWSDSDRDLRYVPVGVGKPGDYLTDRLTDVAIDLIQRESADPFLISLWFHSVHTPIQAKPEQVAHFQAKQPGEWHHHPTYAAMLSNLDQNIARLLEQLDTLGIAEETVVVLTSDNGGVDFPSGKSGDQPPTNNIPFRSGKGTLYEGGIRVPLMIRWPGMTVGGTVCETPVTSEDFLPTFAESLGDPRGDNTEIDGVSLLPLLRDPQAKLGRQTLAWHYPHYYPRMTPGSAIRYEDWKLIHFYEDDRIELYDLHSDPGERVELSADQPDQVARMRTKLDDWRRSTGANSPRVNPAADED